MYDIRREKDFTEAPVHLVKYLMVYLPIRDIGADCYNK